MIRIGISGWRYAPWRGSFYPKGLRQADELAFAAQTFPSIELNGSFYRLQKPEYYANWYQATPPGFVFAHKCHQLISHVHRLKDIDTPLANLFASGLFELREKLGPLLWQLPPSLRFDEEVLENFLGKLPRDTDAALAMARHHDAFMESRSRLTADKNRRLRHALEVRHESFATPRFVELMRKYKVALVVADTAKRYLRLEDLTADFVYVRLHGENNLYHGAYSEEALSDWAKRIEAWHAGEQLDAEYCLLKTAPKNKKRDVFCYFDNTGKEEAPADARRMMEKLGVEWGPPANIEALFKPSEPEARSP